ncbi:hypothetical protein [Lacihabitans sp. LS3-19]|uniref:hypothetical protein n=1 Tax=Lacihabitans sp. LS3-19 TaxID=2487335 RepID=UPI0020CF036C|nr:hypothetical protein [Lacihabitans sp. LS3-19]
MDFTYNFLKANTLSDKFHMILTPDNESRPFLIRFSLLTQMGIFGELNFKTMLWFANLYTVLLIYVFYRKYKFSPLFLSIISLTVLNLCNWEVYFRNDVVTYQLASIALSAYLFYFVTTDYKQHSLFSKIAFYIFLFIVPFGSAIGFIAIFFILIYSFLRKTNPHWLIILILLGFQLFIYQSHASNDDPSNSLFENIFKYKFEIVWAYFVSLGGMFQFFSNSIGYALAGMTGLLIFLSTSYFILRNWQSKTYDFEKLLFLFSAASLAVIVLNRYNYWFVGIESVLVSRYKIYGILILIAGLSFLVKYKSSNLFKYTLVSFFIAVYTIWLFKSLFSLNQKKETKMMDAYNLEQKMVNNDKANNTFEAGFKYEYLKEKKVFNSGDVYNMVTKMLNNGVVVYPDSAQLKTVDFDPSFESDWGKKNTKLSRIEVMGKFPASNRYFIKIIDKNKHSIILNALGRPLSVAKRIFQTKDDIDFLYREFEMSYYKLEMPLMYEVICIQ